MALEEFYKQVAVISLFLAPLMVPVIKKITRIVEKDLKYFTHTHTMQYSTQPCWWQLYNAVLVDEGSSSILRLRGYTDMILLAFQKLNNHLGISPNFLNNDYQNYIA